MEDRCAFAIRACVVLVFTIGTILIFYILLKPVKETIEETKDLLENGNKIYAEVVNVEFYTSRHTSAIPAGKALVPTSRNRDYQRIKLQYEEEGEIISFGKNGITPEIYIEEGMEIAVYYEDGNTNNYYVDVTDIK